MENKLTEHKNTLIMPEGRATAVMDTPVTISEITIGAILLNKYTLTEVMVENTGEARIYKASFGESLFAVKVYHAGIRPKETLKAILQKVQSPFIIRTIDEGELHGHYFEVLPFFRKGDLLNYVPFDEKTLSEIVVPNINQALHTLHQEGIIHRDIKPGNLFFSDDCCQVIVGDFGISSLIDQRSSVRMTTVSRTLGYAAPETAHGIVSAEADYYSLGITLLHLVTGFDPFAGMTDTQILKATIADKLTLPDSIPTRLANLIRGLTVKERTDRWGYEEVSKWLKGLDQPVAEALPPVEARPSYHLNNCEYSDLTALSLGLANNWEEGIKHLSRGFIRQHLLYFSQDLASKAADCEEIENKHLALCKLICFINPTGPLCWQGEIFLNLSELGQAIHRYMPQCKEQYLELLTSSALLLYLNNKHYDNKLTEAVHALQKLAQAQPEAAYYRMYYLLSDNNNFFWMDHAFETPDELLDFLYENREQIADTAKQLLQHPGFMVWLEHLGFSEHIKAWQTSITSQDTVGGITL